MGRFGNSLLPAPSQEMEEDRKRRVGVLKGFWGWNQGHASGKAGRFREHRLQDDDYFITPGCVPQLFLQMRRARGWCSEAVNTQRTDVMGVVWRRKGGQPTSLAHRGDSAMNKYKGL